MRWRCKLPSMSPLSAIVASDPRIFVGATRAGEQRVHRSLHARIFELLDLPRKARFRFRIQRVVFRLAPATESAEY